VNNLTILHKHDYTPFGMLMPGRQFTSSSYRYGMNGQEKDNEITGSSGTHYTAMFWEYDSRSGRRWNLDPKSSTGVSQYACFNNNPILMVDPLGDWVGYHSKADRRIVNEMKKNDPEFRKELRKQKWSLFKYYEYHSVGNDPNATQGIGVDLKDATPDQLGSRNTGIGEKGGLFSSNSSFHIHYDRATYQKTAENKTQIFNWSSSQPNQSKTTTDAQGDKVITTTIPSAPPMPDQPNVVYEIKTTTNPLLGDPNVFNSPVTDPSGTYKGELFRPGGKDNPVAGFGDKVVINKVGGADNSAYNFYTQNFMIGVSVLRIATTTTTYQIGTDGISRIINVR